MVPFAPFVPRCAAAVGLLPGQGFPEEAEKIQDPVVDRVREIREKPAALEPRVTPVLRPRARAAQEGAPAAEITPDRVLEKEEASSRWLLDASCWRRRSHCTGGRRRPRHTAGAALIAVQTEALD